MRRLLLLLPCIFVFACGDERLPMGVLLPKKMEAVMYDVIRADELADFSVLQDTTYRAFSKRTALYDSVFRLHGIGKEDYRRSMAYYQTRPDLLKEMFGSLKTVSDTAMKKAVADTARTAKPKPFGGIIKSVQ